MKAFVIEKYGAHAGRIADVADPLIGNNDLLIEVHAASVNGLDLRVRGGSLKRILSYRLPLILGYDVAGVVVRVGSRVTRFKAGDEVFARSSDRQIGTLAEFVSTNEGDVALKPKSLSMVEAASIPLVGLTAWQVLVEKARLKAGQSVLIQGGSGGVGTIGIQLARHLGATIATTTSGDHFDLVKNLGADVVIDYRTEDFSTRLHDYDVVLDSRGGETLVNGIGILKPGGTVVGLAGPPDPEFAKAMGLNPIVRLAMRVLSAKVRRKARQRQVSYSFLWMRANGGQLGEIGALVDEGIIRPVVDRVFPLESVGEALAYLQKGGAVGKVVVKVR